MMPIISMIVVNYNGGAEIIECVSSIVAQTYGPVECIIVDNASQDGSLGELETRFPNVTIISNDANLGFGVGMNRGFAQAQGDILVSVNQDLVVGPGYAEAVHRHFDQHPNVGAVGGPVWYVNSGGDEEGLDAGGYLLRRRLSVQPLMPPEPPQVQEVFGVSGACPAFRRTALLDVALNPDEYYDEDYFMYYEDIDLFFRLQLFGWDVLYVGDCPSWHRRSTSTGGGRRFFNKPRDIQRGHLRNRHLTFLKNCPVTLLPDLLPPYLLSELLLIPFLALRSPTSLPLVPLSWLDVIRKIPETLTKRERIQSRSRPDATRLRSLLGNL